MHDLNASGAVRACTGCCAWVKWVERCMGHAMAWTAAWEPAHGMGSPNGLDGGVGPVRHGAGPRRYGRATYLGRQR